MFVLVMLELQNDQLLIPLSNLAYTFSAYLLIYKLETRMYYKYTSLTFRVTGKEPIARTADSS